MKPHIELPNQQIGFINRFFLWMNLIQVDVVIGAVVSGMFAARVMQIALPVSYWIVLGLSVWIMYTADHLVDAHRLKEHSRSRRHRWVFRNFRILLILIVGFLFVDILLVIVFLGQVVLVFGMVVGSAGVLYFFLLHRMDGQTAVFLPKEPVVALVYSAGIWGIPVILTAFPFHIYHVYLIAVFFMLVLAGVLILSYYDASSDRDDLHPTFAVKYGPLFTRRLVMVLVVFSGIFVLFLFLVYLNPVVVRTAAVYSLMACSIFLLLRYPEKLRIQERFRFLAEMVFWIPGLALLF